MVLGEPVQPCCLVSAFQCLQQNPPATQSSPTSACPAAPLWLHVPAGCRWIGWEQARNRLSCWEPGILCPALGQLTGKANLGYLSVCCRLSCSITLILQISCLFGICCPAPWNPAQCWELAASTKASTQNELCNELCEQGIVSPGVQELCHTA